MGLGNSKKDPRRDLDDPRSWCVHGVCQLSGGGLVLLLPAAAAAANYTDPVLPESLDGSGGRSRLPFTVYGRSDEPNGGSFDGGAIETKQHFSVPSRLMTRDRLPCT